MVSMFLAEPGKKIICGSTTATMVSRFLPGGELPTPTNVPGLILVTDGTMTLRLVLDLLQGFIMDDLPHRTDAKALVSSLLEANSISFLIGMAVNKSQRSLSLPAKPVVKSRLVRELADLLQDKGKQVMVEYF